MWAPYLAQISNKGGGEIDKRTSLLLITATKSFTVQAQGVKEFFFKVQLVNFYRDWNQDR